MRCKKCIFLAFSRRATIFIGLYCYQQLVSKANWPLFSNKEHESLPWNNYEVHVKGTLWRWLVYASRFASMRLAVYMSDSFAMKAYLLLSGCQREIREFMVVPILCDVRVRLDVKSLYVWSANEPWDTHLVDPASSHMLVSKIKPCMCKYKPLYGETANGSLKQLSFLWWPNYYMDNCSNSRANTCVKACRKMSRVY